MDINIELDAVIPDDACHVSHGGLDGILKALSPLLTRVEVVRIVYVILVRDSFITLALYGHSPAWTWD